MTWKIWWKKNIKENIKENIIIFSLLLSLKNNEENKRKKIKKKVEKILSGCYRLHRNQRSTLELVSRCRKRSMTASAEGWPKTKALCPERRQWQWPQHCTKSRACRPSWRVLFDAWRRWPPRTLSSQFFWFLSSVFPCSVFSPYLYLLKTCSVFSPCVCHNWSLLQWMFLDGLIAVLYW